MLLWIGFIICTIVIVYSGTKLSKYGDIIAEKTGLERAWTGLGVCLGIPFIEVSCRLLQKW